MDWEAFIQRNVTKALTDDGYEKAEVVRGAQVAINYYRKTARFRKGKAFDEALNAARKYLGKVKKKKAA